MEGLLPMVYRRIKNGKTRPLRNSLSTAAYNIADFYPEGYNYKYPLGSTAAAPPPPLLQLEMKRTVVDEDDKKGHHRRWNSSVGDYYSSGNKSQRLPSDNNNNNNMVKSKQQLVRFRSSRTFLSCVTGGDD